MSDVLLPVLIDGAGWQHRRGHAGYAAAAAAGAAAAGTEHGHVKHGRWLA